MSLKEFGNGVALVYRIVVSVLVEGALGWAMFADWIKVASGEERRQKQKEMKNFNLNDPFALFISVCNKDVTEGGVIEHASRNGRGRG